MSENYNIKIGGCTTVKNFIEIESQKFHPYGMGKLRGKIVDFVHDCKKKKLSYTQHDQLTSAWRTPWDVHLRYEELFSPIKDVVLAIAKQIEPEYDWFLKEMWCADYSNGSGANMHTHGKSSLGFSFCYYVKVPDSGPGLTFDIADQLFDMNVGDGDLLIFRHPQQHQVYPTAEERIIVSGNVIMVDGVDEIITENLVRNSEFLQERYLTDMFDKPKLDKNINKDNWQIPYLTLKTNIKSVNGGY